MTKTILGLMLVLAAAVSASAQDTDIMMLTTCSTKVVSQDQHGEYFVKTVKNDFELPGGARNIDEITITPRFKNALQEVPKSNDLVGAIMHCVDVSGKEISFSYANPNAPEMRAFRATAH